MPPDPRNRRFKKFILVSASNRSRVTFLGGVAGVMFDHVSAIRTAGPGHRRARIHAVAGLVELYCKIQRCTEAVRAGDPLARRRIRSRHDALGTDTVVRRRSRQRFTADHRLRRNLGVANISNALARRATLHFAHVRLLRVATDQSALPATAFHSSIGPLSVWSGGHLG